MIAYTHLEGGAPPLIFVHAFGCARSDWDAQLERFAPAHECIAVDLGGHGDTPAQPEHTKVEAHARDIVDLMIAHDLPPAVVIGNSLGCRVTLDLAGRAPERVCGLVLVDGSRLSPSGDTNHAALGADAGPEHYPAVAHRMFAQMFSPDCDPAIVTAMTERVIGIEAAFGIALLADIGRHDLEEMERLLGSVSVPVLAIQSTQITVDGQRHRLGEGQNSPYLELLRATVSDLTIDIVTGSGHYPQVEQPAKVNVVLETFLSRLV
ncbi:MAG: alpha/beta hydrolase [Rhodospirillaceae bacterium]|nr:alpha/beta hydrolase [Rhodospirillaceae bacterium]MDD9914127.1 alpha/beta hydrolase [Rhodospirillaceae bacterium]MDD9926540.1 alpha/beta hydrolase [Rhodospirillaceae bacterium]